MDFGRKAFIDLMGSKDLAIRRLIEEGYEFVTNAFRLGAGPAAVRIKDAEAVASQLKREGYITALGSAYNEVGDPIPQMQSVWRRQRSV